MLANAMLSGTVGRRESGSRPSLASPIASGQRIRAVLFDVDGTLYHQRRMRLLMAAELVAVPLAQPWRARSVWRGVSAYRAAQEELRDSCHADVHAAQLERAADRIGMAASALEPVVSEWMFDRPLKHMPRCRARGLVDLLRFLRGRNIPIGALSDYPAAGKLRALGVAEYFSLTLCAGDAEVGVFKPHPRGFLHACTRWDLNPADVLVVGDRVDADAAGARAAGMPCVIVGPQRQAATGSALGLPSLERLHRVLIDYNGR